MRKRTLAGISLLLSLCVLLAVRLIARSQGVQIPWLASHASHFLVSFLLSPLLMIPLTKINARVLAWRKARGRDIEAEESHETESGIISLRPIRSEGDGPRNR